MDIEKIAADDLIGREVFKEKIHSLIRKEAVMLRRGPKRVLWAMMGS